ncbi:hypothetical protein PO587_34440 [Streptomyces gilvifuscus]|uniref:Uncharacterized protein n=1 Tax=Streptomyces gilvifuscus TaxID=1550617 RepID=A0ABT5G4D8_9ACTN|nr:hypothetical protein [Streptomyces gilvifuscus]MDC2959536.1 hypothetical protein [Streptomyces gilvifuscus]
MTSPDARTGRRSGVHHPEVAALDQREHAGGRDALDAAGHESDRT